MVASIGFANLTNVKVKTSRNLFILGLSLFVGIGLPDYMTKNPDAINTGLFVTVSVLHNHMEISLQMHIAQKSRIKRKIHFNFIGCMHQTILHGSFHVSPNSCFNFLFCHKFRRIWQKFWNSGSSDHLSLFMCSINDTFLVKELKYLFKLFNANIKDMKLFHYSLFLCKAKSRPFHRHSHCAKF